MLKEQGKTLDKPDMKVTCMFIRYCPCKDLVFTSRSKTINSCSTLPVLYKLTEYHAEMSYKADTQVQSGKNVVIAVHKAEVSHFSNGSHEAPLAQCPQYVLQAEVMTMLKKLMLRRASDQPQLRRRAPVREPTNHIDAHAIFARKRITVLDFIAERRGSASIVQAIRQVTAQEGELLQSIRSVCKGRTVQIVIT